MHRRPAETFRRSRRRRSGSARPVSRHGAIAVLFVFFLLISTLLGAVAINWCYLVTVQRHMQHLADVMALAGAPALLDQGLLSDLPTDPADHVAAARVAVDRFRKLNDAGASSLLRIDAEDVSVTAGHVPNITARLEDRQFIASPPYNTLRVAVRRGHDGDHQVTHLINGFWGAEPVDVAGTSLAALDDQLIGFRPTAHAAAPLLPLSASEAAWNARNDADGNGLRELVLRLQSSDAAATEPNGALVDFGGLLVDLERVEQQIAGGVTASQLPGGQLGPVGPGPAPAVFGPLELPARQETPGDAETKTLVELLNAVAASRNPCRALPLFRTFSADKVDVVGFVAVRVIRAEIQQQRLCVTLEPGYLIHTTAWTSPRAASHNPYLFKLRLLQ
jgi:hypothetical protein